MPQRPVGRGSGGLHRGGLRGRRRAGPPEPGQSPARRLRGGRRLGSLLGRRAECRIPRHHGCSDEAGPRSAHIVTGVQLECGLDEASRGADLLLGSTFTQRQFAFEQGDVVRPGWKCTAADAPGAYSTNRRTRSIGAGKLMASILSWANMVGRAARQSGCRSRQRWSVGRPSAARR